MSTPTADAASRAKAAQSTPPAPEPGVSLVRRPLPVGRASWVFVGLFVLALFYTLHFARALLLPITLAVLFSLLLSPVVRWLRRFRVPEPIGAALVLVIVVGGIGAALYTLAEPAAQWLDKAPESLNAAESRLRKLKQPVADVKRAAEKIEAITQLEAARKPREVVLQAPGLGTLITAQTPYVVAGLISTLVLLYFLLASGDLFMRKTVRLIPTWRDKVHAVEVGREIQRELGRYFFTVTLINGALGVATAIAMRFLDMPNPVLWGATAMILNYIPYLGPSTTLAVLSMAAIMTFEDLNRIWPVPVVFLTLVILEGQLIQPIVVGRSLRLNPVMVFMAFLLLGWLWGIAGMFVAVPLLVTLKVICDHVERLAALGEYLGRG